MAEQNNQILILITSSAAKYETKSRFLHLAPINRVMSVCVMCVCPRVCVFTFLVKSSSS